MKMVNSGWTKQARMGLSSPMRIISIKDAVFQKIEASLDARKEDTQLEALAGIDCDQEDMANQRELGDEDPVVTIELIVQWLPDSGEGILDWFQVRESNAEKDPPTVEHGGPLLAFNSEGKEPNLDLLIDNAVKELNESITWAEFELEEDA